MVSALESNVLVLNKYYLAVQVTVVKDAIIALVTGKAEVVDENYVTYTFQQWVERTKTLPTEERELYSGVIRSPSTSILAPQVIRFPECEYTSPLIKTIKYSRKNIYSRDNGVCQYCFNKRSEFRNLILLGTPKKNVLNLDHVIPRSKGGSSSWSNVVTSCVWCNAEKGDKLLEELGWTLSKQPKRPKWQSHTGTPFNMNKEKYWERFLK